jgi:NADPH:quinone reductase-like Zn-dependent oxidoreductase
MKAAIVRAYDRPPSYGDFEDPTVNTGETVVSVKAAAVSPLVVSRASGAHYSADVALPFVPGVDGVGRTSDGRRVYFSFPRPPFGSMAERAPVSLDLLAPVPDELDDAPVAAAAISGMSCWIPLTGRARIQAGESVLVNGATGAAGQMAIQVAKYLGARKVIATGRDEAKLRKLSELGADVVLPLGQPSDQFREAIRKEARESSVGVVLDYLWGPSAETILDALGGPNAPRGPSRIQFVQVGTLAGPTISLAGTKLRSSGLEILGTGLGSSTNQDLVTGIGEFFKALAAGRFRVAVEVHPLSDVERSWRASAGDKRIVFTVP